MLETNNLKFSYPSGPSFEFPDIHCNNEEVLLIIGKSGTGKTTLLHLLAGLMTSNSGTIKFDDTTVSDLSGKDLDKFRGDKIGVVFQTSHFIKSLSVLDNLIMPQFLTGNKIDKEKGLKILEQLNIGNKANEHPQNLKYWRATKIGYC